MRINIRTLFVVFMIALGLLVGITGSLVPAILVGVGFFMGTLFALVGVFAWCMKDPNDFYRYFEAVRKNGSLSYSEWKNRNSK